MLAWQFLSMARTFRLGIFGAGMITKGSHLPAALASPLVERRVHEAVRTSLRWVVDGEMPRKLTQ